MFPPLRHGGRPAHAQRLATACLCAALAACTTVGPDYQRPPVKLQPAWSVPDDPGADAGDGVDAAWWRQFDDPTLDALIAAALAGSPTLASAAARIDQARAQLRIASGGLLPQMQGKVAERYLRPDLASQVLGEDHGSNTLQLAVEASWEIDFWGAVRRGIESDRASLLSSEAAYHAARVSLTAGVASTYLGARTLEQRLAVARINLDEQGENLRIATVRFRSGAASELDLRQAQTQYGLTVSQLPALQIALDQARHALGVLIGETPDHCGTPCGGSGRDIAIPAVVPAGMPHDLLRRRPDVVQAELAAMAQSARIGQSEAALYPSFALGGSFGLRGSDAGRRSLADLFSWNSRLLTLGADLAIPLFDRGRLKAQVAVQDALFRQAMLAYQSQVLKAQQEVEDALSAIRGNQAARDSLGAARDGARRGAALAAQRYKSGATDYTTVIAAEQSRLQLEDSAVVVDGNLLQAYVSVYRALGGGWSGDLGAAGTGTSTAPAPTSADEASSGSSAPVDLAAAGGPSAALLVHSKAQRP